MAESREELEEKIHQEILENREPIEIKIHEAYSLWQWVSSVKIGSFRRKAKGQEYVSPRILLHHYFKKHVGKNCHVLEGKASIGSWRILQNADIIILAIPKE